MKKRHQQSLILNKTTVLRTLLRAVTLPAIVLTQAAFSAEPANDSVLGSAPGSYRITAPDSVIRIPFKLFRGDILRLDGTGRL